MLYPVSPVFRNFSKTGVTFNSFAIYVFVFITIIMCLIILGRKIQHDTVLVYYSCKICNMDSAMNRASAARRACFGVKGYPFILAFQFPGMLSGFISEIRTQYRGVSTSPLPPKKKWQPATHYVFNRAG